MAFGSEALDLPEGVFSILRDLIREQPVCIWKRSGAVFRR